MEPGNCELGIELGGALEMSDAFGCAIGGGEQETDLVLVGGVLRRKLGEFFIRGEGAVGVLRLQALAGFGFKLGNGLCGEQPGEE